MSRFYTLSQWCEAHGVKIRRDGERYDSGFIFSYRDYDSHYDYYDVVERPDVVRDWLKGDFGIR